MIQEIAPHRYDNAYRPECRPKPDSYLFFTKDHSVLIQKTEEKTFDFPHFSDFEASNPTLYENAVYLFSIDDKAFFLSAHLEFPENTPFILEDTQFFRKAQPKHLAFAAITGYQIANWYQSRRFCGHCGTPLRRHEKERMMYCEHCGQMEYPKICPGVIIAVTDGNRLLLSKYNGRTYKKYALLAGFTEVGETFEETVQREVMEEVGLKVKNIRYYKSQPWAYSDTLLAGFFCDLAEPDEIHLDAEELSLAEWFEAENIPIEDESRFSLTQDIICHFKETHSTLLPNPR